MVSKAGPRGNSTSGRADVLPPLAVQSHQLQAIRDPATPTRALAQVAGFNADTVGRPIRIWSKEPSLARRLNDALASPAEADRLN